MHCPDGLHFNPNFGVCDFPENVDCGAAPTSPPGKLECIQACLEKGKLQCIAECLAAPTNAPDPEPCEDGFHRVPGIWTYKF